jgi:hypothetical protein
MQASLIGGPRFIRTVEFNFLALQTGIELIPAVGSQYVVFPLVSRPFITALTAANNVPTNNGNFRAGNDAGRVNVIPDNALISGTLITGLAASTLNSGLATTSSISQVTGTASRIGMLPLSAPVLLDLTVIPAAPGLTVMRGWVGLWYTLVTATP